MQGRVLSMQKSNWLVDPPFDTDSNIFVNKEWKAWVVTLKVFWQVHVARLSPQAALDKDLLSHMEQLINQHWLLWLFSKIDTSLSMTADSAV